MAVMVYTVFLRFLIFTKISSSSEFQSLSKSEWVRGRAAAVEERAGGQRARRRGAQQQLCGLPSAKMSDDNESHIIIDFLVRAGPAAFIHAEPALSSGGPLDIK